MVRPERVRHQRRGRGREKVPGICKGERGRVKSLALRLTCFLWSLLSFSTFSLSLDQKLVSLVLERCLSVSHLTYQIGADQGGSTHARRLPTADDCELLFPRAATLPCRGGGRMTDEKEREGKQALDPGSPVHPPSHHDAHAMPCPVSSSWSLSSVGRSSSSAALVSVCLCVRASCLSVLCLYIGACEREEVKSWSCPGGIAIGCLACHTPCEPGFPVILISLYPPCHAILSHHHHHHHHCYSLTLTPSRPLERFTSLSVHTLPSNLWHTPPPCKRPPHILDRYSSCVLHPIPYTYICRWTRSSTFLGPRLYICSTVKKGLRSHSPPLLGLASQHSTIKTERLYSTVWPRAGTSASVCGTRHRNSVVRI